MCRVPGTEIRYLEFQETIHWYLHNLTASKKLFTANYRAKAKTDERVHGNAAFSRKPYSKYVKPALTQSSITAPTSSIATARDT